MIKHIHSLKCIGSRNLFHSRLLLLLCLFLCLFSGKAHALELEIHLIESTSSNHEQNPHKFETNDQKFQVLYSPNSSKDPQLEHSFNIYERVAAKTTIGPQAKLIQRSKTTLNLKRLESGSPVTFFFSRNTATGLGIYTSNGSIYSTIQGLKLCLELPGERNFFTTLVKEILEEYLNHTEKEANHCMNGIKSKFTSYTLRRILYLSQSDNPLTSQAACELTRLGYLNLKLERIQQIKEQLSELILTNCLYMSEDHSNLIGLAKAASDQTKIILWRFEFDSKDNLRSATAHH